MDLVVLVRDGDTENQANTGMVGRYGNYYIIWSKLLLTLHVCSYLFPLKHSEEHKYLTVSVIIIAISS